MDVPTDYKNNTQPTETHHRNSVTKKEHATVSEPSIQRGDHQQQQTKSYEASVIDRNNATNSSKLMADDSFAYNNTEPYNSKHIEYNETNTNIANKKLDVAHTSDADTLNLSVIKEATNVTKRTKSNNDNNTATSDLSKSTIPLELEASAPVAVEINEMASPSISTSPNSPQPPLQPQATAMQSSPRSDQSALPATLPQQSVTANEDAETPDKPNNTTDTTTTSTTPPSSTENNETNTK